jgi:hypothetical protein
MTNWIKCEERLPKIHAQNAPFSWSSPVLCFLIDETMHIACLTSLGDWKNFDSKYSFLNECITHWMLLPDAPEDE